MIAGVKINTLIRNQRFVNSVISHIKKPTIGQYIIESLIDKNVNIAFAPKNGQQYSPIFDVAEKNENFDIVFDEYEKNTAYRALTYSKLNNNIGVVINTSVNGFDNINDPIQVAKKNMNPILLLSFFDCNDEQNNSSNSVSLKSIIKESLTLKVAENFSIDMEEILSYAYTFPAGPVHLNISNELLNKTIDFSVKNIQRPFRSGDWRSYYNKEESVSELQYLEQQYKRLEKSEPIIQKSQPNKKKDNSDITHSHNVCKMHELNRKKKYNFKSINFNSRNFKFNH